MKNILKLFVMIALPLFSLKALGLTQSPPVNAMSHTAPADIRDIRGPKHIPSPWLWPAAVAGGLALGALGYAAWRRNRRRALVAKLPYEIALDRLEGIRSLLQPETAREFSFAVSEIVRDYVENRFQVWAARRTTEEFLHDLVESSDELLGSHQALLAEFLHHCDLAKFARWILSVEQMESMLLSARTFVLETAKPAADRSTNELALAAVHQGEHL